jgi:hypothetical protein
MVPRRCDIRSVIGIERSARLDVTTACFNFHMQLSELETVIDELVQSDPRQFADAESIRCLQRLQSRLEGFGALATGAFDASGDWALDGAKSAAAWIATACRMPKGHARRQVRRGRQLRQLPKCAQAWLDGDISGAHVDSIAALHKGSKEATLERDEAVLVEHARTLRFESFLRTVAYWDQLADPDGTEEDAEERRARRDVYLVPSFDGMWLGKITLDPISGAIVSDALKRIEDELFMDDWAKARDVLGRDPTPLELCRTPEQRRADALVVMATRSSTAPADGRKPAPLFSVLVGYETLHGRLCELAQGLPVSPGSLLPWLEQADIERAVFEPGGRVECSVTARFFTGATRRAIELRDRTCRHPYCDTPAEFCQADHIVRYTDGGLTEQENGRLLCGYHNRLRNQRPPPRE